MLRGARRAIGRTGALSSERVWIIALPVVVATTLDWFARYLIAFHLVGAHLTWTGLTAPLLSGGGPLVPRTAIILVCGSAAAYGVIWAAGSFREVLRRGGRSIPGPAFIHALAGTMLALAAGFTSVSAARIPSARSFLADARQSLEKGDWWLLHAAIHTEVDGVRALCRDLRDSETGNPRFYGAAGLYCLGDRSPETRLAIHDWIEAKRDLLARDWRRYGRALDLVRHPGPLVHGRFRALIDKDAGYLAWWDRVKESFRQP
ncbi:MAG: hypothetical protein ACYTDY_03040 [Planctomycetota bacterium]|jgi:hypothetical protein